ncbi:MAG: cyclodeaminase/cyclohydrolase family protein [Deltaproteobacteria bacterium]|nr:cyclodeaminase/cyclohydrolase family protein [Deltaproteobacteria bacterium]
MPNDDDICRKPLSDILEIASSGGRIPGACFTAMSAALGASMSAMVANLTLDKGGSENGSAEIEGILKDVEESMVAFKALTDKSMGISLKLQDLDEQTGSSREERGERSKKIDILSLELVDTLELIAKKACELLEYNMRLAEIGKGTVASDAAVAAVLLEAAVRAAFVSSEVKEDLDIKLASHKKHSLDYQNRLLSDSDKILKNTLAIAQKRNKSL